MLSGPDGPRPSARPPAASSSSSSSRLRRQHGLQLPLHPLQLTGWLTFAALSGGSFAVLVPALPERCRPAASATLSALVLLHAAAHLGAALVDPAEAELRRRRSLVVPALDRSKHAHVIERGRCNLCLIDAPCSRTKHCGSCNKCVAGFDHHCKWLNHCVGSRNYPAFLMCVSTAVAAAALVAALAFAQLVMNRSAWYAAQRRDNAEKEALATEPNATTSASSPSDHQATPLEPTGDAAFLVVVTALGLLAVITAGLLLHLCFFHVYISFLGLTTYEYIRRHQQQGDGRTQVPTANDVVVVDDDEVVRGGAEANARPVSLFCGERRTTTTTTTTTTVFTCSVFDDAFADATPTPPTTPSSQDCRMCVMSSNSVAPEAATTRGNHAAAQSTTPAARRRRSWNCCVSVPDSPNDPQSPTEPRCLVSLCKHKFKSKPTPDAKHLSRGSKIRMIFRALGSLGNAKRRGKRPESPRRGSCVDESAQLAASAAAPSISTGPNHNHRLRLPPLESPAGHVLSESELERALAVLQQRQQRCPSRQVAPRRGRRGVHHPHHHHHHRLKTTQTLSPIRESGLSNPTSPSRRASCCAVTSHVK